MKLVRGTCLVTCGKNRLLVARQRSFYKMNDRFIPASSETVPRFIIAITYCINLSQRNIFEQCCLAY